MVVLMLGSDPTVFDPESPTRRRLEAYAQTIGSLHVLSRAPQHVVRDMGETAQTGALTLHTLHAPKLLSPLFLCLRARRIIREYSVVVVSAQDPFEHGIAALYAVWGTPAGLHVQVHTDFCSPWFTRSGIMRSARVPMPFMNRVRRMLADYVLPRADAIRAVSVRIQKSLEERYGMRIAPVSVIPIAIDSTVPPAVALPPHTFPFALITVGRIEPEKRIEDILLAIRHIAPRYPSVGLIVVGNGRSLPRLKALTEAMGLTSRVMFLGERSDAWGLMQSAQAYIQASAYEGYGRTLLEAALARVPIITTDVGVVGDLLTPGVDVLAAPPGDPVALSVHIAGLVEEVAERRALAMHAEQKVRTHLASLVDQPKQLAEDLVRAIPR